MNSATTLKQALESAIRETARLHSTDKRRRKLSYADTLKILIGAEGGSLAKMLHRAGVNATPAALSQRRADIDPSVLHEVLTRFNSKCTDTETFRGYRVIAADGTAVNMSRNPDAPSFVYNASTPKGYNQLHLNPFFDVLNKVYLDAVVQPAPAKDEIGAVITMLRRLDTTQKVLLLLDRGYESYNLISHALSKDNLDFVLRIKQNRSAMREVARLPMCELDCDLTFTITTTQTQEDKKNRYIFLQVPKNSKPGSKTRRGRWDFPSPYKMSFRIVRVRLENGSYETLATSLPRSFTSEDIKELYRLRWQIELGHRDAKYTAGLVNLHGKSDRYVEQEIFANLIAFNLASRISRAVVVRQPKDGIYAYQVNFKMAMMLTREFFMTYLASGEEVMREIAKHTVPIRPGRSDERNIKAKGFSGFCYRVAA